MKKQVRVPFVWAVLLALAVTSCSGSGDDDDSSPAVNSNIRVKDFQVSCWIDGTENYWMFYATIEDDDGPQDIVSAYVEIIDGSFSTVDGFELEVVSADGQFCSEFYTAISDAEDCIECQDYGFRVSATDESNNQAEKTYPGDTCSVTDGFIPEENVCPGSSE